MLRFSNKQSHICSLALVALVFLGYNSGLIGENMIKPNTLCMIRGVPTGALGADCNGKIVTAERNLFDDVWAITPEVVTTVGGGLRSMFAAQGRYLHPLDNPSDDLVDTISTRKQLA